MDVLLGGDPPGDAFERLHAWLEAGAPEGASATAIDLRFAGQVILRSDPPPEGDGVADPRGGAGPP